jgi:hypothetical protein
MQKTGGNTGLAYMSSWGSGAVVDVFTLNGRQVGQITNGLFVPQGLFVDSKGSLWVANLNNVLVFPHGGLTATTTLNDPVGDPVDVTVCPNGTAYVADFYDTANYSVASIQVYPPGSTSPTDTLTYSGDSRNPYLTCDAAGNVFTSILIGQSIGDGRVIEFPLGQQAGAKDLGISLQDTITEYTENGTPTGVSIATVNPIEGIALTRNGKTILGADPNGPDGLTWSFPAGKQERVYTCCGRIGPPMQNTEGVAFYPGQKGI